MGSLGNLKFVVAPEHTIDFRQEGLSPVLSTPSLIWFLEHAAIAALEPFLDPGEICLGTEIEVAHLAPTPPGHEVRCTARVVHCDGPRISLQVEARDPSELVARGTHQRFVVKASSFSKRVQAKRA